MQDYERKGGIKSKVPTQEYLDNFDRIFRQHDEAKEVEEEMKEKEEHDNCTD